MTVSNNGEDVINPERPNVHISYQLEPKPYHMVVAELASKYGEDSATVLDVGCGVGLTLLEINKIRPDLMLYGADIDDEVLTITKSRVSTEDLYSIETVDDLVDPGRLFDIVIMSHVLEHTLRPLDELSTVMKLIAPNGVLILAVPNPVRLQVIRHSIRKRHYVNRGHAYAWDRSHWMNFLENIAKLNVIEYSEDYFLLRYVGRFKVGRRLEIWLAKVFPWFAFSHIAVIRK